MGTASPIATEGSATSSYMAPVTAYLYTLPEYAVTRNNTMSTKTLIKSAITFLCEIDAISCFFKKSRYIAATAFKLN